MANSRVLISNRAINPQNYNTKNSNKAVLVPKLKAFFAGNFEGADFKYDKNMVKNNKYGKTTQIRNFGPKCKVFLISKRH